MMKKRKKTNAELALAFSAGEGNSGLEFGLEEILLGLVVLLHEQVKDSAGLVSDHLFGHIAVREDLEAKNLQNGSTLITVSNKPQSKQNKSSDMAERNENKEKRRQTQR